LAHNSVVVDMRGIVKDFPGVRALDGVDFDLRAGEVHLLVGENGAGKSTLVKILAGVEPLDRGTISINGEKVSVRDPAHAQNLGVGIVYQEMNLVPYLTVAQNIFMRREPVRAGFVVDVAEENRRAREVLASLNLDIEPNTLVRDLSLGQQQMVAFAWAICHNPRVLILDEPTSSLAEREVQQLFAAVRQLKAQGVGIIYITHRLEEFFQIGDRVTVLRDGQFIGTMELETANLNNIIQMMVGREISEMYPKEVTPIGEEALRLEGVTRRDACEDVNLVVHRGEVVGLFGLVGAGRTELARMVFGLDLMDSGRVFLFGERVTHLSPSAAVDSALGYLSEDRKGEGLCLSLPVKENIVRAALNKLFPWWVVSPAKEEQVSKRYIEELSIATPSTSRLAVYLSGGTQQKVVVAQWLCAGSEVLILDEPTRGIDVGAKVEIYHIINEMTRKGAAILMISSELPEVMGMSDRIYVMHRGRIRGEFSRGEAIAEEIISCAFGTARGGNNAKE
jgi:ribose transport system ATP-binding protein